MNFSQKIRAARAALNWSREDLANRSGLSAPALASIETGGDPKESSRVKIIRALETAGIEFIDDGVRLVKAKHIFFDGPDWFTDLLEDVYQTLLDKPDSELLIENSDDRESPPDVINLYRKIRNAGIRMRQIVCEGNSYMIGPVAEYKWVPKAHFMNWVTLIYGDKVARCISYENRGVVNLNHQDADNERKRFELLWSLLPAPNVESTANVRF